MVAVVVRGLSWWCTAGDLRVHIRQQRTPGRRANPALNGGACTRKIPVRGGAAMTTGSRRPPRPHPPAGLRRPWRQRRSLQPGQRSSPSHRSRQPRTSPPGPRVGGYGAGRESLEPGEQPDPMPPLVGAGQGGTPRERWCTAPAVRARAAPSSMIQSPTGRQPATPTSHTARPCRTDQQPAATPNERPTRPDQTRAHDRADPPWARRAVLPRPSGHKMPNSAAAHHSDTTATLAAS